MGHDRPSCKRDSTPSLPASRAKSLTVFARVNERLDHVGILEVAVELVELGQPEIVTRVIGVGSIIRIASQVAEVLHQDKRAVEFLLLQRRVLSYAAQRRSPGRSVSRVACSTKII